MQFAALSPAAMIHVYYEHCILSSKEKWRWRWIFLYCMQLTRRSHSLAESETLWRAARPASNLFTGPSFTMCDIDWVSPQMHGGLSVWPTGGEGWTSPSAWAETI